MIAHDCHIAEHDFAKSSAHVGDDAARWRDARTIDAVLEANMDGTRVLPDLDPGGQRWPIRTLPQQRPSI